MQLDPLTFNFPDLTPFQFAGNDPIENVDLDGLEPYTALATFSSEGGNALLIGQAAGQSVKYIGEAGKEASVFETTLQSVVVTAKIPSKIAASAIKPIITASTRVIISSVSIVDKLAVNINVIHEMTLQQKNGYYGL